MDATTRTRQVGRAYVELCEARDWDGLSALLAVDVVYVLPQTRERIPGRELFIRFNTEYPGDWHLALKRIVARS